MYQTQILGTGSYLPTKILSNADLANLVETSDQWIVERTGIRQRHIAADNQATSDLALEASMQAISAAGLKPSDIEFILVATVSPDQVMPNTACVLQTKLGCKQIAALDVSAACSGFIYALAIANQFVKTGVYKKILVVGAEVLHRLVDYKDRSTCILFGDGAGAFIVGRGAEKASEPHGEILSEHLHADGSVGDLFVLPAGGSRLPFSQTALDQRLHYVRMKGKEIFKHAVRTMADGCQEALKKNGLTKDHVDWFIPHQANVRILEAVAKSLAIPMEKVILNLENIGNTSAATIPIAFDYSVRAGRIKRGDLVLLTAFGAGLTSGSLLLRY